jgi:hypothetical protein
MKAVFALLALSFATPAFAASPVCGAPEKARYLNKIAQFNVGEVTSTDVVEAQLYSLSTDEACGKVSKEQYCFEAPRLALDVVAGVKAEQTVGQRTAADLLRAEKGAELISNFCAK